jgi:hypothetical protein
VSISERTTNSALTTSSSRKARGLVTHKNITQTVADICGFILHKCVHVGEKFFNEENELAYDKKYEKIRN